MHVTTRADLVANSSQTLFPMGNQAVVVAEDLWRDFAAQLREGWVGGLSVIFSNSRDCSLTKFEVIHS